MEELRAWVRSAGYTGYDAAFLTDHTLQRYLTGRNGDVAAAIASLQKTLEWRAEAINPFEPSLGCPMCDESPHSHNFLPLGHDKSGNVVVYGNPPRASHRAVEPTVRHIVHYLERAFAHPATASQRWCWLVDFSGFGFSHAMEFSLARSFASVFADHFVERLAQLVLLNPPTVFSIMLKAVRPFADKRTLDKIIDISGDIDTVVIPKLEELGYGTEICGWMKRTLHCSPAVPGNLPPLPRAAAALIPYTRPDARTVDIDIAPADGTAASCCCTGGPCGHEDTAEEGADGAEHECKHSSSSSRSSSSGAAQAARHKHKHHKHSHHHHHK